MKNTKKISLFFLSKINFDPKFSSIDFFAWMTFCKWTVQVCKYEIMQVCKDARMQGCKYAHICKYARICK